MLVNGKNEKAAYIIETLKKADKPVSGEEFAEKLSVSRVAVWKIIKKLQNSGYHITSEHHGYSLCHPSDKPLPWELSGSPEKLRYYEETASTMKAAGRLSGSDRADGTVIVAGSQTEGIACDGGQWTSPEGGIYLTRIRTTPLSCDRAQLYTLTAAFAASGILNKKFNIKSAVKPPGEIYARDKKIGGVLTTFSGRNGTITRLSLGIGINVNINAADLPEGASSISELTGGDVSVKELIKELLDVIQDLDSAFTDNDQSKIDTIRSIYS